MKTLSADEEREGAASDGVLVGEVLGGRVEAFEALVGRYERAARGVCYGVLGDWHAAQDAAQEGFVLAYRNLGGLREPGAFGGWLMAIMRQRAVRMGQRRWWRGAWRGADGRGGPLEGAGEVVEQGGEVGKEQEEREALLVAVGKLPEQERVVVMLRYFGQMPVAEVGRVLGVPVGTVTKRLSRAHERLRTVMKGDW